MVTDSDDHPFQHFHKIDLGRSHVLWEPPLIFMCGGEVDITRPGTLSVRELFFESISHQGYEHFHEYCIRAELFKDFYYTGRYSNLFEFENDLAHFASLVVIFLESAGSIVELGLFSTGSALKEKLMVFVSEDHYEQNSFIRLGPLESLRRYSDHSVYSYPWDTNSPEGMEEKVLKFIFSDIESAISRLKKSEYFDQGNPGHITFLVYECINIYRALRVREIQRLLLFHEIDVSEVRIKNYIYLLKISGYVEIKTRGRDTFYVALKDVHKVQFSSKSKSHKFDYEDVRVAASMYYSQCDSEAKRLHAIESSAASSGGGES